MSVSANSSSFQLLCITKMAAEATAGLSSGKIMRGNTSSLLHPITVAASISSSGISPIKLFISQVTNGSVKQQCARMGARCKPVKCTRLNMMNSGIIMVTTGTIFPNSSTLEILRPILDLQILSP